MARRAVIEALLEHHAHPTVDEIAPHIAARTSDVHVTTVYRTLDTLTELGVVSHVHTGHGPPVFHLAEPVGEPGHVHARCSSCGKIIDLPGDLLDHLSIPLERDWAFRLDPQHVALSGTCRDC